MNNKTRLTPFARFFLFLILILPLAYLGAAYYNGEDPVAKVKGMVSGEQQTSSKASKETYNPQEQINALKKENQTLKSKIKSLEAALEKSKSTEGKTQKWGN